MGLLRKNCPVETTKHLTQAQVLDQLYYNPDMGTFLWRHGAKGRKAWDRAGYARADLRQLTRLMTPIWRQRERFIQGVCYE